MSPDHPASTGDSTPGASRAFSIATTVLLLVAFFATGGVIGLAVGVPLDRSLSSNNGHGLPGLGGLLIGTPAGAVLGLLLAAVLARRMAPQRRLNLGTLALAVGAAIALGLYGAAHFELIAW